MINVISKLAKYLIPACIVSLIPFAAFASGNLEANDFVGMSFWIISIGMVAATVFFFMESMKVDAKWRTSLVVAGLVTMIAAVHYFYMRAVWIETADTPTVYRYIDWILTVPLQIVEFYLILAAVGAVAGRVFWNLLVASLVMLIAGYVGEVGYVNVWLAFIVGMLGWIYILYAIFAGDAQENLSSAPEGVQSAFRTMRLIVLVGWAIYPLGYVFGYAGNQVDAASLNAIYNIADFVNKIAFGLMIWAAATSSSEKTA
ncbi:bacteriorhodopsin-like [SAR116 cluster bacterium]|nr:bacteriorhodopsin-like [SAR116 cluster bacterium]